MVECSSDRNPGNWKA